MARIAARPGGADADRLVEPVDAAEYQVEPARPEPVPGEGVGEHRGQPPGYRASVSGAPIGSAKARRTVCSTGGAR